MNFSQFDPSSLPGLHALAGWIGSFVDVISAQWSDDTIVVLITFLYELDPSRGLF